MNMGLVTYDEQKEELQWYQTINEAKERYTNQQKIAKDAKYIEDLLYKDYVRICTSYRNKYDYIDDMIKSAFRQQKTDDAKKKSSSFKMLKSLLQEDFFNGNTINLIDISCGGYEGYYYACKIKYEDKIIVIELPIKSEINTKNFYYAHEGKIFCGWKKSVDDSILNGLIESYYIEEVAEAIQKFLENNK